MSSAPSVGRPRARSSRCSASKSRSTACSISVGHCAARLDAPSCRAVFSGPKSSDAPLPGARLFPMVFDHVQGHVRIRGSSPRFMRPGLGGRCRLESGGHRLSAVVVLPTECVVLISTSCLKISRARISSAAFCPDTATAPTLTSTASADQRVIRMRTYLLVENSGCESAQAFFCASLALCI